VHRLKTEIGFFASHAAAAKTGRPSERRLLIPAMSTCTG
jgi:hypothetical protein